jgi:NIMA (never in mitosis gene a)-related kinase
MRAHVRVSCWICRSLGLFLYELCTLRHAFDGNTLPSLVMKILKGVYPPIPPVYSEQLKALIAMMLSLNPAKRPNITQILRLEFVRARMEKLAKQYPEIQQSWATSMKLHSQKELFLHNMLPAPLPSHAAPAASPSSRNKSSQHTASSHKPAATGAKKPSTPATAAPVTRSKAKAAGSASHVSAAAARPRTPPAALRAPAPVRAAPPPLATADDEEDEEDSDDDDEARKGGGEGDGGRSVRVCC